MNQYLSEAFQKLDMLNEETFSVTDSGLQDFVDFDEKDDVEDVVDIIDVDAETEDDLEDSYVGKVILDCCVCHSKLYKDVEDVVIEDDVANVGEECPFCYTADGFKVIGQVSKFGDSAEEDKDDDSEKNESLNELFGLGKKKNVDNDKLERKQQQLETAEEELRELEKKLKNADSKSSYVNKRGLKAQNVDDYDRDVADQVRKKKQFIQSLEKDIEKIKNESLNELFGFGKKKKKSEEEIEIEEIENEIWELKNDLMDAKSSRNAGRKVVKGMYDATGGFLKSDTEHEKNAQKNVDQIQDKIKRLEAKLEKKKKEFERNKSESFKDDSMSEDFKDVSITTDREKMEMTTDDDGKVTITTEPVDNATAETGDEVIEPLDADVQNEIEDNVGDGEEIEVDMDDFDEESFDELGEAYLKKVYENVNSYATKRVSMNNGKLILEGVIKFTSGNEKKTKFVFENKVITKRGKVRLIGENREIARGRKSFTITGNVTNKKFMTESFNYNYGVKSKIGKVNKLYGTIRK